MYNIDWQLISFAHQDSMTSMEEELTQKTLYALNDMRIKFPGKSDEEAEYILDKVFSSLHYCCGVFLKNYKISKRNLTLINIH